MRATQEQLRNVSVQVAFRESVTHDKKIHGQRESTRYFKLALDAATRPDITNTTRKVGTLSSLADCVKFTHHPALGVISQISAQYNLPYTMLEKLSYGTRDNSVQMPMTKQQLAARITGSLIWRTVDRHWQATHVVRRENATRATNKIRSTKKCGLKCGLRPRHKVP